MADAETLGLRRLPDEKMASELQVRSHTFAVDVNAATGGDDLGPDPHDLYDAALGACKTLTMMWLARKKGWAVRDIRVQVRRDASREREGIYVLHADIEIDGDLSDEQRQALKAAAEKCPVQKLMTQATTQVLTELAPRAA